METWHILVFRAQDLAGKVRRWVLRTKLNFEYVSYEHKSLCNLAYSMPDVSSTAHVVWMWEHDF